MKQATRVWLLSILVCCLGLSTPAYAVIPANLNDREYNKFLECGATGIPCVTIQGSTTGTPVPMNSSQVNGVAISTSAGVTGTGTQRFVVATDDPCMSSGIVKSSAAIAATASTQLVALATGQKVFVCGFSFSITGTAPTAQFQYGTGATCATGTTNLTGAYAPTTGTDIVSAGGGTTQFASAASTALCLALGGTTPSAQGYITFVQQ